MIKVGPMKTIAIFEDDGFVLEKLVDRINALKSSHSNLSDIKLHLFSDSTSFNDFIQKKPPVSLFLLDLYEGDKAVGLNMLSDIKVSYGNNSHVIMHSNSRANKDVVKAIKLGADHYLMKDCEEEDLELALESYLVDDDFDEVFMRYDGIEVAGATLKKIKADIPAIIASSARTVFINGETGTGKEVVAEIIKGYLPRKDKFITVNCSQLLGDTVVSELFGHKKGAFTGANSDKTGLIEAANGGWIFLDEIAELPMGCQSLLLRAIENQVIKPLGSNREVKIDVRFITATKENILKKIRKKEFRDDLWNRINQIVIELPALKDRKSEIRDIAEHIAKNIKYGPYKIPKATMILLEEFDWRTGNVRELKNCIVSMTVKAGNRRNLIPSYLELHRPDSPAFTNNLVMGGSVTFDFSSELNFQHWSLKIFDALCQHVYQIHGEISINQLSKIIGVSRATITKYKEIIAERKNEEAFEEDSLSA